MGDVRCHFLSAASRRLPCLGRCQRASEQTEAGLVFFGIPHDKEIRRRSSHDLAGSQAWMLKVGDEF